MGDNIFENTNTKQQQNSLPITVLSSAEDKEKEKLKETIRRMENTIRENERIMLE